MTENPNHKMDLLDPSIKVKDLTPEQVQQRIIQYIGFEPPGVDQSEDGMGTYFVLVALDIPKKVDTFKDKDGKETKILMPESTADKMKWASCTGMVVAMGPDAYKDPNRFPHGPTCRLGDWITFPRHEGVQIHYRGVAMHWLPDDKVAMRIKDPSYVVRG